MFARLAERAPPSIDGAGAKALLTIVQRVERDALSGSLRLQRGMDTASVLFAAGKLSA